MSIRRQTAANLTKAACACAGAAGSPEGVPVAPARQRHGADREQAQVPSGLRHAPPHNRWGLPPTSPLTCALICGVEGHATCQAFSRCGLAWLTLQALPKMACICTDPCRVSAWFAVAVMWRLDAAGLLAVTSLVRPLQQADRRLDKARKHTQVPSLASDWAGVWLDEVRKARVEVRQRQVDVRMHVCRPGQ